MVVTDTDESAFRSTVVISVDKAASHWCPSCADMVGTRQANTQKSIHMPRKDNAKLM